MKRIIAILAFWGFLWATVPANAQQTTPRMFCIDVVITFNGAIIIDRGEGVANKSIRYTVLDENNQKLKVGSQIAAINYMCEKGWILMGSDFGRTGPSMECIFYKEITGFDKESIDRLFENLKLKKE